MSELLNWIKLFLMTLEYGLRLQQTTAALMLYQCLTVELTTTPNRHQL